MIIHSIIALVKDIEKWIYKNWVNTFLSHMNLLKEIYNVKVDLSNYATKGDIKNATRIDASNLALKLNLAKSKAKIDKIDTGKLKLVPTDLNKLSNVVNNDAVKNCVW